MSCAEIELLICDYTDGTLGEADRRTVELHLEACPACAELARDAAAAVSFLGEVEEVEPPPELVTRILFQAPTGPEPARQPAEARERSGWFRRLFDPILQPRFAMGMAMTILSFSMMARIVGVPTRQLTLADLDPVKVWGGVDDKLHRVYDRAVKYYENLRLVYEVQSRLREWSEQEEEDRKARVPLVEPVVPAHEESGSERK